MRILPIIFLSLLINPAWAANECQQPVVIVNIANLACVDENTGKVVHQNYQGPYKLDIYSNDEHNNWYRGDFYGLDDD